MGPWFFYIESDTQIISGFCVESASYRFRLYTFVDPLFVFSDHLRLAFSTPLKIEKSAFEDFKDHDELVDVLLRGCHLAIADVTAGLELDSFLERLRKFPKRPMPSNMQWSFVVALAYSGRLDEARAKLDILKENSRFMSKKSNVDDAQKLERALCEGQLQVDHMIESTVKGRRALLFRG